MIISPAGADRIRNVTLTSTSGRFTTSAGRRCPELRVPLRLEGERSTGIRVSRTEKEGATGITYANPYPRDSSAHCGCGVRHRTARAGTGSGHFTHSHSRDHAHRNAGRNPRARRTAHCHPGADTHPVSYTRTCACRHFYASSPSNCHTATSRSDAGHNGTDMAAANCRGGVPVLSV